MAHVADLDLTVADIGGLSSLDALAGFFTRLGYPTGCREELPPASLDLTGDTAKEVRRIELLAEDDEGDFRVLFVKLRSITVNAWSDLVWTLGNKRRGRHLVSSERL